MSLRLGPFDRRELAVQRRLFSECFPENHGKAPETEAFYRRKFCGYPAEPASYEYIARDDDGYVGYYAALPYAYRVGDTTLKCGMVCEVMTAPRMQGKGVFTKLGAYSLAEMRREGLDFVTGYPRRAAVIPGHLKVGWSIVLPLPLYALPLATNAILARKSLGAAAPLFNGVLTGVHAGMRLLRTGDRSLTTEVHDLDFLSRAEVPAFYARAEAGVRNSLIKTSEFLRWRLSLQETTYRIIAVRRGEVLVGLSIVRPCTPEGVPSLAILDAVAENDAPSIWSALRAGWLREAHAFGGQVVLMMMQKNRFEERGLWRLGFVKTPVLFQLIVNALSDRAAAGLSLDPAHWDLKWIDSDDL